MSHNTSKEMQEASMIGRIMSLEGFLLLMGIASLVYGIINEAMMNIFWGVVIVPGVFILHKVRKKDWDKHWAEMEAERSLLETRRRNREKSETPEE